MKAVIRKLGVVVSLFLIGAIVYGMDWYDELRDSFGREESVKVGHSEGNLYWRENMVLVHRDFDDIPISEMELNTDSGFLEVKILGSTMHVILGDEYILVADVDPLEHQAVSEIDGQPLGVTSPHFFEHRQSAEQNPREFIRSFGIPYSALDVSITSSNYMIEMVRGKRVEYSGEYLSDYLYHISLRGPYGGGHNPLIYPWVEDVEGPGIGEWIQIDISEGRDRFYVLNGFVDPYRPHLYKMNSRVKAATVIGTTEDGRSLEQQVRFLDFVYFKTIQFPEPVVSMRLVIDSAYPGSRWQDTAISAIMPPHDTLNTSERAEIFGRWWENYWESSE
ncbi:hypothetical protein SAMN05920897_11955 [Alkalispirochaeta americana]|uniref:NAD glycohydrolase translocation F5/8 type C domain-containing protein n=1 Tax=Alkalispirochaeta americana TaxID=159291 RepID=A0A1N6WZY0_9SPIO|nr:hypothetical protein [Alkalispirochaeta americana]SIQ95627.1 hypothetical protein SAMN05920897_11955 [Alkalispirochaeta americana]